MSKKYVWLKLRDNFFQQKPIKKLRRMAGGATYTLIYLKMQLASLKNEGKLYFDGVEENFADELALELDETSEDIQMTILYLQKNNLLEIGEVPEEYILPQVIGSIGSETASAERMRKLREKRKVELLSCNNVTPLLQGVTSSDIEKEREEDKEKDIERESSLSQLKNISFKEKLNILKKIIIKSTGCSELNLSLIFKPIMYKEIIDTLLDEIQKSEYLLGKAASKPNLNTFTVISQVNRIIAGAYRTNKPKKNISIENINYPANNEKLLELLEE